MLCLRYLVIAICFGAAALLLWRRPGQPMALLAALACALLPMAFNLGGYVEAWPYPAPWDGILGSVQVALGLIGLSSLLLLVYLFPDGRFSPRWLWLPAGLGVALMAGGLLAGDDGWAVVMAGMAFTLLVGGAGQIHRYRRADDRLRTQIKPVVAALVALPVLLVLGFAFGALLGWFPFRRVQCIGQPASPARSRGAARALAGVGGAAARSVGRRGTFAAAAVCG